MSLVSYGAGSSSEESDTEETVMQVKPKPQPKSEVKRSSEKKSLFSSLPPPKSSSKSHRPTPAESHEGSRKKGSLFSSLPEPMSKGGDFKTTVTTTKESAISLGVGARSLNLPAPKTKKQPLKITLPLLPDHDSDEDDEPVTKKPNPSQGIARLFSQLPKPKNAGIKEANRILIPHTLTKRTSVPPTKRTNKPVSTPHVNKPKSGPSLVKDYDNDDDTDEEDNTESGSFFSLDKNDSVKPLMPEASSLSSTITIAKVAHLPDARTTEKVDCPSNTSRSLPTERSVNITTGAAEIQPQSAITQGTDFQPISNACNVPQTLNSPSQDAPLSFKSGGTSGYVCGGNQYGYHKASSSEHTAENDGTTNFAYQYSGYSQVNVPYMGDKTADAHLTQESQQRPLQQQNQSYWEDQGFQKMMGKRKRGKEAIDIIDVNADDQLGPVPGTEWLYKSMTEEKEYRGQLKKEQLPSSQSKRKHQITFLAHQAKERELELKNQWANNRQTRKQTQAKYGF